MRFHIMTIALVTAIAGFMFFFLPVSLMAEYSAEENATVVFGVS